MCRMYTPKPAYGCQMLPAARGHVHGHYYSKNKGLRANGKGNGFLVTDYWLLVTGLE